MNHLDTFLAGRGDRPDLEIRLMAAELHRARRDARRCTRGHQGSPCASCRDTLRFLKWTRGEAVPEVYVAFAAGRLLGQGRALEAALVLRRILLAEADREV